MSPLDRLIERLKPRSTVLRTTLVIGSVVLLSQYLSLAFFYVNLYEPELRQHARLTALQVTQLREAELAAQPGVIRRLILPSGLEVVRDPKEFPSVKDKPLAEFLSAPYVDQIQRELGEPVAVYFRFKPRPTLWLQPASLPGVWVREPIDFISAYNPFLILAWLFGVPLLTLVAIVVLVRQLNRPLKRLQLAALRVAKGQHATMLEIRRGPSEIRAVNRAFNQMTRDLQQAERDRSFMLAGISHDLRTPLTRLRLTAELVKARDPDMAEGMVLDIEDMDAILDQFIAFMRDGSDEKIENANINMVLAEVAAQFASQTEVRFLPEDVPDMPMKRLSLKRLVGNLVNNAVRYGAAPVELHSRLDAPWVVLTVRDHGAGINEDEIPQLLEPFRRGESARTTQGSGLGLAIVRRIVRLHHGELALRNHPQGGLEVTVRLPLARRPG